MRIAVRDHRGIADWYTAALEVAHHRIVNPGEDADCLLIDHDVPFSLYPRLCDRYEKVFLYPHGAEPRPKVFPAHPHRVEQFVPAPSHAKRGGIEVGWSFCRQAVWRRPQGRRVLFAPFHRDGNGWLHPAMEQANEKTATALEEGGFEVTVRTNGGLTYEDIDRADVLVAGCGTVAFLGVARGCPTVMYGQQFCGGDVASGEYLYDPAGPTGYPWDADHLGLRDAITGATQSHVGHWRAEWIGDPFDAQRFVRELEDRV